MLRKIIKMNIENKRIQVFETSIEDLVNQIVSTVRNEIEQLGQNLNEKPDTDKLLTRKEVCQKLQIHESTLNRWMKNKTLERIAIEGRIYFRSSDIEKLIVRP